MTSQASDNGERERNSLVLGGSFFPLHEGHLNLLRAARDYLQDHRFKRVDSAVLLPSHPSALQRKFPDLPSDEPDVRSEMARELLKQQQDGDFFVWDDRLLRAPNNVGMRLATTEIAQEMQQQKQTTQLVQVVGADSQVRAVLRNPTLPICLVVDARGVPPENADLLTTSSSSKNNLYVVHTTEHDKSEALPPQSSTMLRYLHSERFHPSAVPKAFSLNWLTDTGQTLGAGRQGLVRLMRLGHTPVAVKMYKRGQKASNVLDNCFVTEEPIWHRLAHCRLTPRLIATGTHTVVTDQATGSTRDFSYIVTEVGIPFDKLLPKLNYTYYWKPKDVERFRHFLDSFELYPLPEIPREYQPILPTTPKEEWALKAKLIHGMIECQERLEKAAIVHRDLKVSNFVLLQDGTVGLVDFGTARARSDLDPIIKSPRGSMRMYPLIAADSFYFDYGCDEYVLANSIAEVLNETPIYAECGEDVRLAIGKRRNNEHPTWNPELIRALEEEKVDNDEEDETNNANVKFLLEQIENCESIWKAYEIGDGRGKGKSFERNQPGKGRFFVV